MSVLGKPNGLRNLYKINFVDSFKPCSWGSPNIVLVIRGRQVRLMFYKLFPQHLLPKCLNCISIHGLVL